MKAELEMTSPDPPDRSPRRRPLVRLWLVAVLLFAAEFVGRAVLATQPGAADGYVVTMLWQMGWYAAGLVVWFWWASTRPVGEKVGCWVGAVLIAFAVLAVLSSSPK
jgi:hypothetical protein